MISQSFLNSFPIVASILGQRLNVDVKFEGFEAKTNGQMILLPCVQNVPNENVMLGFLAHEAGHLRFTDLNTHFPYQNALEKQLLNLYEDQRIEEAIGNIYFGAIYLMGTTAQYCFSLSDSQIKDLSALDLFMHFLCLDCRCRIRGQLSELEGNYQSVKEKVSEIFSDHVIDSIMGFNDRIKTLRSTEDSFYLAREVIEFLKSSFELDPQDTEDNSSERQPQSGKGMPGDELSENNSSESSEKQSQGGDSAQSKDSSANSEQDQQSRSTTDDDSDQKGEGADASNNPSLSAIEQLLNADEKDLEDPTDISGKVSKSLSDDLKDGLKNKTIEPAVLRNSVFTCFGSLSPFALENGQKAPTRLYDKANAESSALRQQLQSLIEVQSRSERRLTSSGRRLNHSKLSRLSNSNLRVFKKTTLHQTVDTAVHVLLDLSGSMEMQKSIALRSALALKLALDKIPKCNSALTTFPCQIDTRHASQSVLMYGEKLNMNTLRRFSELEASGGTPLAEALWDVSMAMHSVREKRKILIVITDGKPNDIEKSKRIIKQLEACGIEVYGIGIYINIGSLFKRFIQITDSRQLQSTLLGLLRKVSIAGVQ